MMQSVPYQSQLSSSHIDFPYNLELVGAYTMSYHLIILDDQYNGVVNLPHHSDWYISPIQSWIEATCMSTYKFGKNFYDIVHAYDLPSIPPILNHHAGLHFLNKVSLVWLVTKDKEVFFMLIKYLGGYIGFLMTLNPFLYHAQSRKISSLKESIYFLHLCFVLRYSNFFSLVNYIYFV